jgi:peptide/nickel transport system substrate-binding protein
MIDSKDTVPGTRLVLVRNPNYFRKGIPYLDKVIIDFNVSPHLQIQRVQAGALDLAGSLVTSADYLSIKGDPKWSRYLTYAPDIAVIYLAFNLKQKPFQGNLKLRQAINLAINKQQILKLINGRGVVMQGILPPTMPGADPKFSYYPYDPQRARTLLKEAGYGTNKLSITLTYQETGDFDKVAQEIQAELKEIGITITLKPVSTDIWYGSVAYSQKEGPLVLAPWGQDYPDPSDFFDPILTCNAGSNAAFYCNPALDTLAAKARGNLNDQERIAQYHQMERMVMADAPWVPIYDDALYDFHGPHLGGFYIHPVWPFNYAEYYLIP